MNKIENELNWLKEKDLELYKKIRLIVLTNSDFEETILRYTMKYFYNFYNENGVWDFINLIEGVSEFDKLHLEMVFRKSNGEEIIINKGDNNE